VAFSSATYSVAENAGPAIITVNLSNPSAQTITVNYATSNGSATSGSDYTASSGTLTFTPGDISETFNVTITDDSIYEGSETVNIALSSPSNATRGSPSTAVLTINDNETQPTVAFSSATYPVGENAGPATITVDLSGASSQTITVNYATSNGSATAGSDYTAASGTLTFNPGDISKTFNVTITDDSIFEGSETVNLALTSPANATLPILYAWKEMNKDPVLCIAEPVGVWVAVHVRSYRRNTWRERGSKCGQGGQDHGFHGVPFGVRMPRDFAECNLGTFVL
jgi:hypothetical protein